MLEEKGKIVTEARVASTPGAVTAFLRAPPLENAVIGPETGPLSQWLALMGGDERIVEAHDRAVTTTLGWIEKNAVLTRMQDGTTGAMVHAGDQKTVVATFRHDIQSPDGPAPSGLRGVARGADRRKQFANGERTTVKSTLSAETT